MNIPLGTTLNPLSGDIPFSIDLDRSQFRHAWILGKSGTGKSTLLRLIFAHAVRNGWGIALLDPHGDLHYDCLNYIPKERLKDLIIFDPQLGRMPGIGMFDYPDKDQSLRIVLTQLEAHMADASGKRSLSIFRNCARAVLEAYKHPTFIQLYRMIADDEFAQKTFKKCKNPLTTRFYQFWWSRPTKDRLEAFAAPLNKIEPFMEPGIIEFIAQTKNLNFRKVMDEQKIVLCRLPKSYLEEQGTRTLGSFLMMKFKVEASRRLKRNKPFLIVADEFHNFITGIDVDTTFGESRKFGTHYIVTSQTRAQLGDAADVIAGNVSHIFAFRMNATDAEEIEKNIGSNHFDFKELVMMENFTFRALSMTDGAPTPSEKVLLYQFPEKYGDEVPARKAMAWASENNGTERPEIEKQIAKQLK